ncbi:flagellar M-ring protein FliF [bacterium]|nr:flagellar M-ring protein FliF [bacterium]
MKPYLTEYIEYLRDIWGKLGINQRVSLGIIIAVIISVFAGLILWAKRPDFALLYSRLEQQDAAAIIERLRDENVPYSLKNGGSTVYVPSDRVYDLRLQFAGEGVPRSKGIGFEIFDKVNFGITDFVQRMNYIRAIQGEIGRTIAQIEEVVSARVHIVMPETELFEENQKHTTASIALTMRPGAVLDTQQINAIRYLTSTAVEGLDPKHITIIDQYGNMLSKIIGGSDSELLSDNQLSVKKNVEMYLATKVQSMLEGALGVNNAIVRVNAELNFEQIEVTEEKFNPESAVVRTEQISSEKSHGRSDSAGPAGTASNLDEEEERYSGGEENSNQKETVKNTYEIDRSIQKIIQTVGDIKRLSAAVFIRKNQDANGTLVDRDPQELNQLEDIIKNALGFNLKRNDSVVVKEIIFNETDKQSQQIELEKVKHREFIIMIVKNASVVVLIIVLLIVFGQLFKKTRIDEGSGKRLIKGVPGEVEEDFSLEDLELPSGNLALRKKSMIYHNAITKIAQEHPDSIVQILKGWLTEKR